MKLLLVSLLLQVSANITLFVHVQDVNDHTPTFSQLEYTFLISSKMPAGHIIGKISVSLVLHVFLFYQMTRNVDKLSDIFVSLKKKR